MIKAYLHNYNLDCFREGTRLIFNETKAPFDHNTSEQQDGIRVVTGLTGLVQKALGYAEEISVTVNDQPKILTINKRSRNKWIARLGEASNLSDKQHRAIESALKSPRLQRPQNAILSNYAKAALKRKLERKIESFDFSSSEALINVFLKEDAPSQSNAVKIGPHSLNPVSVDPAKPIGVSPPRTILDKQKEAAYSLDLLIGSYQEIAEKAGSTNPVINLRKLVAFKKSLVAHFTKSSEKNSFDIEKFNQSKEKLKANAPYIALYFESLAMIYSDDPEQLLLQVNDHILQVEKKAHKLTPSALLKEIQAKTNEPNYQENVNKAIRRIENELDIQLNARRNFSKVLEQIKKHQSDQAEDRKEADRKEIPVPPTISKPHFGSEAQDLQLIQTTIQHIAQQVAQNEEGHEISNTPFMDQWNSIKSTISLSPQGLIAIETILTQMDTDIKGSQPTSPPKVPQSPTPQAKKSDQVDAQLIRRTVENIIQKVLAEKELSDPDPFVIKELQEAEKTSNPAEMKYIAFGVTQALKIAFTPTAS